MSEAKTRFEKRYEEDVWVLMQMRDSLGQMRTKHLGADAGLQYNEMWVGLGRLFDEDGEEGFHFCENVFRIVADPGM